MNELSGVIIGGSPIVVEYVSRSSRARKLEALRQRTLKSGFDFIDFWAIDFDYQDGQPFEHHWQDYRTRKDGSLKTISDAGFKKYPKPGKYAACVKVVDVFGYDTSITVEVKV